MSKLDLSSIKTVEFPRNQYYQTQHPKKQIYLHHTVSGEGVMGDINWWKQTESRVATAIIISRNGDIYQAFSSKYWAHHLGIKSTVFKKYGLSSINTKLNQQSIAIEIDSWGGLTKKDGVWYHALNKPFKGEVVEYPDGYRGYKAFEKYTDESTRQLLEFWGESYGIDLKYKGDEIFDIDLRALKGEEGVWTHTSVRPDKSDLHPQKELIDMLKSF
jgi:hypothetical protein